MTTEQLFESVAGCSLFRIGGPDIDLCQQLHRLAQSIRDEEETDWTLGEYSDFALDDLVIAAYWALADWIADGCFGGSPANDPYFALCGIFSPGMSDGPEEGTSQPYIFEKINEYMTHGNSNTE